MNPVKKFMGTPLPHFSYARMNLYASNKIGILADHEVIHHIDDMAEFYQALGYTSDMQKAGIEPEVYRWVEFSKDGAAGTQTCLQTRIIDYLNKHSATFREKYGSAYESRAGTCQEDITNTSYCSNCRVRPAPA